MPSEEAKKEMLQKHFLYEFEMLIVALEIVRSNFTFPMLNRKRESITLETSLIHARSLLEFFYYEPSRDDRPYAQEFLKERVVWADIRPDKTEMILKLQIVKN